MSRVYFDVGDESTVVVTAVLVAQVIDKNGQEKLRTHTVGDPKIWTKNMLLQAALDKAKDEMRSLWGPSQD